MGEIKSTLDLVLEKTQHLKLSNEEKNRNRREAIIKSVRGTLQRYQDGLVPLQRLDEELQRLVAGSDQADMRLVFEEVLERIQPDLDNSALLDYLQSVAPSGAKAIRRVLQDYADALRIKEQQRNKQLLEEIQKTHRISGSAVRPNLEADAVWEKLRADIRNDYEQRLQEVKTAWGNATNSPP